MADVSSAIQLPSGRTVNSCMGDGLLTSSSQARLLVLDALEGVVSYIRRRLQAVHSAGGFVGLASECVEELASGTCLHT